MPSLADIRALRFGPLGPHMVHICIDMQRLFAEPGEWHTPSLAGIVPAIARIAARRPARTLYSRFMTPARANDAHGQWQTYYRRWQSVTGEHLAPGKLDLVPELARHAGPGSIIDKSGHSCFDSPAMAPALKKLGATGLIVTGVETDVCVLATVLDAIDLGLRVVIVEDAVTSSSPEGHGAAMNAIYPRYDQQIEVLTTDELLRVWTE
jgi:nicotinamidase-related amidase